MIWPQRQSDVAAGPPGPARSLQPISESVGKVSSAAAPVLAMLMGTAWMIADPGLARFLQAMMWACGFVFLGLAIDARKPAIGAYLTGGIMMPLAAWLSAHIAPELALLATLQGAAWVLCRARVRNGRS